MNLIKMRDLPQDSKPYEKYKKYGAKYLTNEDLLAVIIRNGTKNNSALNIAQTLVSKFGLEKILNADYHELMSIDGIGEVKAIELKCIVELSKRFELAQRKDNISFATCEDIADYARCSFRLLNYEMMKVIYLNNSMELIGEDEFSDLSDSVKVPIKKIIKNAILNNAFNVVLVHNHPSGDLTPSKDDLNTTKIIFNALHNLSINLLDHIIVTDNDFCSIKNNEYFNFNIH